jgi:glycosyltransferase involved in cell wall biosynthesis
MCDVSIIVPMYNCEDTIEETISSIELSSFKNFEIILVDDGSKDNSIQVVENLILKSNFKISLFIKDNEGPSKARNFGVTKASGKYIVFIDSDDKIHSTYLEKAFNKISNDEKYALVYSNVELFGAETGKWNLKDFELKNFLIQNSIPIFAMFKKDNFLQLNGFDENLHFAEDWELWIRFLKNFGSAFQIKEELYYYRKSTSNNSVTDKAIESNKIDEARKYIYDKHYSFYLQNGLGLSDLINENITLNQFKNKYYNKWYRKVFKTVFKK